MSQMLPVWKAIATLLLLTINMAPAYALYLDSMVFSLESDKTFFARQLTNDTPETRMYDISVRRIDRPGKQERSLPLKNGELMYTPLHTVLSPGGREFFKLFYRGPEDDRERYYRVAIREIPVEPQLAVERQKSPLLTPVVALDTILVVRPRKLKLKWQFDKTSGILTNTGNTWIEVVAHSTCSTEDDSNITVHRLLPGEQWQHASLRGAGRRFVIAVGRYYPLTISC